MSKDKIDYYYVSTALMRLLSVKRWEALFFMAKRRTMNGGGVRRTLRAPIGKGRKQDGIIKADLNVALDRAVSEFFESRKARNLRPATVEAYSLTWRKFDAWLREKYPEVMFVSDVENTHVREFVLYLTEEAPRYGNHPSLGKKDFGKGLSANSVNGAIRNLRAMFNYFEEEKMVEKNPTANIRRQRTDDDVIQSFTDDEVTALLDACDQRTFVGFRDYVFQFLLLDTGVRNNEATGLRFADVNYKTRSLYINGDKAKNRKGRVVPISKEVLDLLEELQAEATFHFPEAEHYFMSTNGVPMHPNNMNKRLKFYGEVTGVEKRIRTSAHTWRHTAARNYVLNGGDAYTLMRLLGHSSVTMTRRYVQMTDNDVQNVHERASAIRKFRKLSKGSRF